MNSSPSENNWQRIIASLCIPLAIAWGTAQSEKTPQVLIATCQVLTLVEKWKPPRDKH